VLVRANRRESFPLTAYRCLIDLKHNSLLRPHIMKLSTSGIGFFGLVACLCLAVPATAAPQAKSAKTSVASESAKPSSSRWRMTAAGPGLGFTVNPARFDFVLGGEYFYRSDLSLGFDIHLIPFTGGMAFDMMPQGRYYIPVDGLPKVDVFVGAGFGALIDSNGNGGVDFMIPSFGYDYELTRDLTVGSDFGLHIVTDFSDTNPIFHLLLARVKYRF